MTHRTVVVAITGATGAGYGVRMMELLSSRPDVEVHLVLSKAGVVTLRHECGISPAELGKLATVQHRPGEIGAAIASGSFPVDAMLVAPCSVRTLSGIANSYDESLVVRAADVTLKERRRLVLMLRETPLHAGHLRLMSQVTEAGAIVMPPVPAFYTRPASVDEIVDDTVHRALDVLGFPGEHKRRWDGTR